MIVRMGLFRRKPDLSVEEFARYWRESHGPLVKQTFGAIESYTQNLIVDRSQKGIDYQRGEIEIDAISQLFFPSISAMRQGLDQTALESLRSDEANFMTDLVVATAFQNTVIPLQKGGKKTKRMSLLRKRPDISQKEFQGQWLNDHANLVKRLPGLLGYRQNIVIDWQRDRFSETGGAGDFGVDGIVELWFEDETAIERAFQSPQGQTAMMHAREFLAQISTYVVQPVDVIVERDLTQVSGLCGSVVTSPAKFASHYGGFHDGPFTAL